MKKKVILAATGVLVIVLLAGAIFMLSRRNKPEPPTYDLELTFEVVDDQKWMDLLPITEVQSNLTADTAYIVDGALRMGAGTNLSGVNLKAALAPGRLAHVHMRLSPDGPCAHANIFIPQENGERTINLSGCPYGSVQANAGIGYFNGKSEDAELHLTGNVLIDPQEWIDFIFWLHPDGDKLYYFAGNAEKPDQLMYGAVTLPEEWQSMHWVVSFGGYWGDLIGQDMTANYTDVDFVRQSSDPLVNYLYYEFPAYRQNQAEVDAFLKAEPPLMPELQETSN